MVHNVGCVIRNELKLKSVMLRKLRFVYSRTKKAALELVPPCTPCTRLFSVKLLLFTSVSR